MSKLKFVIFVLVFIIMASCQLQEVPMTTTNISFSIPEEALVAGKDNYKAKISNIATGRMVTVLSDANGLISTQLEEGVYNIQITAHKILASADENSSGTVVANLSGIAQKVNVIGNSKDVLISLSMAKQTEGFVIKEIYYTGSTTPSGSKYNLDQFIEIYNNSDSVLYADGISIAESQHGSDKDVAEFTNYPNDFIVGAIYTIPGTGKTYPIPPRSSIVIADRGVNHKKDNVNCPVDLSKANFEWYDAGTPLDIDVPEVSNLIRTYCYSNTVWRLYTSGSHSYIIFKMPESPSDFVTKNSISVPTTSGSNIIRVKVANSLIIDGVELAKAGVMGSKSLSTTVDLSFTYCSSTGIGKSVRRKVQEWKDGKAILQDTNDSANDFISNADPKPGIVE